MQATIDLPWRLPLTSFTSLTSLPFLSIQGEYFKTFSLGSVSEKTLIHPLIPNTPDISPMLMSSLSNAYAAALLASLSNLATLAEGCAPTDFQ